MKRPDQVYIDKNYQEARKLILEKVKDEEYFYTLGNWARPSSEFKSNVLYICRNSVYCGELFEYIKFEKNAKHIADEFPNIENADFDLVNNIILELHKNLFHKYVSEEYLFAYLDRYKCSKLEKLISSIQYNLGYIMNSFYSNHIALWNLECKHDNLLLKCFENNWYLYDLIEAYFKTIYINEDYKLRTNRELFFKEAYLVSQKHVVDILEEIADFSEKKNLLNESYRRIKSAIYRNPTIKHPAESHYLIFLKDYIDNIDIFKKGSKYSNNSEEPNLNHLNVYKTFKSNIPKETKSELYKLCSSILETDSNSFLIFLSGENINYPLKIKWLIRTKDGKNSSKPSLFYFLEQLSELRIIEDRVINNYIKIGNVFVDFKGEKLKNMNGSAYDYGKKDSYQKESILGKEIIDDIILKIKKSLKS